MDNTALNKHTTPCLACKSLRHYPLYCWNHVPLSVVGLQNTSSAAKEMANLTMDIRRCANCGHVFNSAFNPKHVGYHKSSNLVYNKGNSWSQYQDHLAHEWMSQFGIENKCVIEIGSGEGLFLGRFLEYGNRCIGFEPGHDANQPYQKGIEVIQDYFSGSQLQKYPADMIICRHVIEHLPDPLDFLQEIAMTCQLQGIYPLFCAEVPMIDKALNQIRINDFLYEHVSNFTFNSFKIMFELAGFEILEHKARYEDEVITIVAKPKTNHTISKICEESAYFHKETNHQLHHVHETFLRWQQQNKKYAIWAATGKGAAFLNMFALVPEIVPTVVDSDPRKFGKYVPGMGQEIRSPQYLIENPVDYILIASNWHGRDIEHEIRQQHHLSSELFVYLKGEIVPLTAELEL